MAITIRTLNQIVSEFEEFATQHRQINNFACGTIDDFATSGTTQYYGLWITYNAINYNERSSVVDFDCVVVGRVKKDRSNLVEIHSDTSQIVADLRAQFSKPDYGWNVEFSSSEALYEPYHEDEVAGWSFVCTITQAFTKDWCQIPFIDVPVIGSGTATNTSGTTYVPISRVLTINGVSYDLSADRTWTISGSGGTWGSITGTLSNQTDLQAALDLKANLASPTFTGTPSLPTGTVGITQSANDNSTKLATTAYVYAATSTANWLYSLKITTGDQVTTSSTAGNITDLIYAVAINSVYTFQGAFKISCSSTGGVKFAIVLPTGATMWMNWFGSTTSNTVVAFQNSAVSGTLISTAYCQEAQSREVLINGTITTAGTAGNVQFQFASGTNLQTSTIYQEGTYLRIQKVA